MIGKTLGHYRVVEKIGAGGMRVVWRARDERLQRVVAIKVLRPDVLADESARARFRGEALALSRLNHANVCTVHDSGEHDAQVYLVMECVAGQSLDRLLKNDGLPVETVLRYGAQIAAGLAHAHQNGLLHRDLKSSNVMITPDGVCKVLDFGLAKDFAGELEGPALGSALPTPGQGSVRSDSGMVGTLSYMAPEVLRGEAASVRSDIWCLGAVLYEIATGSLPFEGRTSFELGSAIQKDMPKPMPAHMPASLRNIILRCLTKEPAQRYQTAGEVGAALEAASSGEHVSAVPPHAERTTRGLRWMALAAIGLAFVAGALGLSRGWLGFGTDSRAPISSVAVLPFKNLSPEPEQEYFADGVTEQIIMELSKVSSLRVISRTSAMRYKNSLKPLPEIARELDVDAVLEGSVNRSDERVRITVNLIRALPEEQLWSSSYDRDLRNILSLQSEVARTAVRQIDLKLTPHEETRLAASREIDPEAYRLYLLGRFHMNQATEPQLVQATQYFEQAIDKAPLFAEAHAGLALAWSHLRIYVRPKDIMAKAREAAQRALELDANLSEAHAALGEVYLWHDWDAAAAERELLRAMELNPGSLDAHARYANYLSTQHRHEEAVEEIHRALELDPLSGSLHFFAMWALLLAASYDDVIVQADRALELEPRFFAAFMFQGMALAQKGRFPEALQKLETAVEIDRSPLTLGFLAIGKALAGQTEEARQVLAEMEKIADKRYVCAYEIGSGYAILGDNDRAFYYLQKGLDDRADCMAWLHVEPWLESLRSDPRYQEILDAVGFEVSSPPRRN